MTGEERMKRVPAMEAEPPKPTKPEPKSKTFKLREMITAHGEDLTELKLREPRASDIMRAGYPVILRSVSGNFQLIPDEAKMTAMMVELAAIPPSSVGQMHPSDWATISTWLVGFFVPDWEQAMS
jgi:hypothetical protein